MPKFRFLGDHPVSLFQPEGGPDALIIKPGQVITAPGELLTSRPEPKDDEPEPAPLPDDAHIVAKDGEEKAWAKALWELVVDTKPATKSAPAPVKEN